VSHVIKFNGCTIPCSSRRWRLNSALWLAIPQLARRAILGILWRVGIK
jgi:hypothetical protein